MNQTCPICKDACSEVSPFVVVCSTRDNPPKRIGVNAECCEQCISKIKRKEKILPYFIGPGSAFVAISVIFALKFRRQVLFHMPSAILLVTVAVFGLILLAIGGIISLRIGTTEIRLMSMKQFLAQCSKELLGTFAPVITIQSAAPNGVTLIPFSSATESEVRNAG